MTDFVASDAQLQARAASPVYWSAAGRFPARCVTADDINECCDRIDEAQAALYSLRTYARAAQGRDLDLIADFGAVGDGATINDAVIGRISERAAALAGKADWRTGVGFTLRVRPGRYLFSPGSAGWWHNVRLIGTDRDSCVFASASPTALLQTNIDHAEGITFENIRPHGWGPMREVRFRGCRFVLNGAGEWSSTTMVNASSSEGGTVVVEDCVFDYPPVYVALWIYRAKFITVRNCTFSGSGLGASHALRIAEPVGGGRIEVTGNRVTGGKTGLFIGSSRGAPIDNVLIQGNVLDGYWEEGISLDGFGNNPGLCPVIASGTVAGASNDAAGRLVITPDLVYHDGASPGQPSPISLRSDWTTYRFTFGEGSGLGGTVARIRSFDAGAGTLTLDIFTPAGAVTPGGDCGVHAGFFGPVVRDNVLRSGYGSGTNSYATGISLWLNVFNALVENNTVEGGANGVNLAGALVLSTYQSLAYNNTVRGNRFLRVNQIPVAAGQGGAVRAVSYYGGRKQYGSRFEGNLIDGGAAHLEQQAGFAWSDNDLRGGASLSLVHCGGALPPASAAQIGRRAMRITDDGAGAPVEISYWVCRLSGGEYAWVQAP